MFAAAPETPLAVGNAVMRAALSICGTAKAD